MTETERAVIEFADTHAVNTPRGRSAVEEAFRPMSLTRYFDLLHKLIYRPDVVEEFPQTCSRHQRLEAAARDRRDARSALRKIGAA